VGIDTPSDKAAVGTGSPVGTVWAAGTGMVVKADMSMARSILLVSSSASP